MEVIVAKTAGFCFGVKRAVDKVYEQIEHAGKPIYTYGPIIHNACLRYPGRERHRDCGRHLPFCEEDS